nr:unnamed protein product [Spirometra erinaceieuropaei]
MRPDPRGGSQFEEEQIRKWHLGPNGYESEEGAGRGKKHIWEEKEEKGERVQKPEGVDKKEREDVHKDVGESRIWEESRKPRGDSPALSQNDHASDRYPQHHSKPLYSWKPIEESQVRKWHEGAANQEDEEARGGDVDRRTSELERDSKAEEEEDESMRKDVGETRIWNPSEESKGREEAPPHGDSGPIRHWKPIEESQVRQWHQGAVNQLDGEDRGRDGDSRTSEGGRDRRMEEKQGETIRTDAGETHIWKESEENKGKKTAPPDDEYGPIRHWPGDNAEIREPEGTHDNWRTSNQGEERAQQSRDTPEERNDFRPELQNGEKEHQREFYEPGMRHHPDDYLPVPFPREPLRPPYLRPRFPDGFNPGSMDWFRNTPPGRLEHGRHPDEREERQDSETSRLVSSRERTAERSAELEEEKNKTPEKKQMKLIVGPAENKAQTAMKVRFVAGGRPTAAPPTVPLITTGDLPKTTEATATTPAATTDAARPKESLVIPVRAEGSQSAGEGGRQNKPQAQIVLNVYQDRNGKLNFELAPNQDVKRSQKTGPQGGEESSRLERGVDAENEDSREEHTKGIKEKLRKPEKQRSLVEKTSFVGEYPPHPQPHPQGWHPHTHSRRMLFPHQEHDHSPPLYSASFPGEYFDRFGPTFPAAPDLNNRLGRIHPHPPDALSASAMSPSDKNEPEADKRKKHQSEPSIDKRVPGLERDTKKSKGERPTTPSSAVREARFTPTPSVASTTTAAGTNRTKVAGAEKKNVDKASFSRKFDYLDNDDSFLEECYQNKCSNQCPNGVYKISPSTGCLTCDCCEEVDCYQYCEHGYEADEYGCPICECALPLDDSGFLL